MTELPLAGIRVIDFGRFIAGPYCAMLLADMGADVIRVDRRQGSEDRYTGPVTEGGEGGAFLSLNRNKRSLTLDTSKPGSREIVDRLAKTADVVLANRGSVKAGALDEAASTCETKGYRQRRIHMQRRCGVRGNLKICWSGTKCYTINSQ